MTRKLIMALRSSHCSRLLRHPPPSGPPGLSLIPSSARLPIVGSLARQGWSLIAFSLRSRRGALSLSFHLRSLENVFSCGDSRDQAFYQGFSLPKKKKKKRRAKQVWEERLEGEEVFPFRLKMDSKAPRSSTGDLPCRISKDDQTGALGVAGDGGKLICMNASYSSQVPRRLLKSMAAPSCSFLFVLL